MTCTNCSGAVTNAVNNFSKRKAEATETSDGNPDSDTTSLLSTKSPPLSSPPVLSVDISLVLHTGNIVVSSKSHVDGVVECIEDAGYGVTVISVTPTVFNPNATANTTTPVDGSKSFDCIIKSNNSGKREERGATRERSAKRY